MAWYHALHTAFNALAQRRREERQMADEMRFHLEMETRWLMSEKGLPEDEAKWAAQRAFGGVEAHKDAVRDERGASWLPGPAPDTPRRVRPGAPAPGPARAAVAPDPPPSHR